MDDTTIKSLSDIPAPAEPVKTPDKATPIGDTKIVRRQDNSDPESGRVIKVKADPPGLSNEERTKRKKALAGAIAYGLKKFGEIHVRGFGDSAVAKGAFAIGIASGMVSTHGCDLYCRPCFIQTEVDDREAPGGKKKITGISYLVVSSETPSR